MNRHAPAPGHETDDLVGHHRCAAFCEAHPHVAETLDVHTGTAGALGRGSPGRHGGGGYPFGGLRALGILAAQAAGDPLGDRAGRQVALPDRHEQRVGVVVVESLRHVAQRLGADDRSDRQRLPAQFGGDLVAPAVEGLGAPLPREPLADPRAGPARGDELQPVLRRTGVGILGGHHLHGVAGGELGGQRHEAAIDPSPDAAVAHLGVDGVGEVHRGGAHRQGHHVAARREDEHLVLLELDLEVAEELLGIVALLGPVDDPAQPGQVVAAVLLVVPVGGHAVLGPGVHLPGPYLHLHDLALGTHHRRVQTLVEIELGHRDVVLESPLERLPDGVDGTQHGVAVPHALGDDPDAHQVVDVVEVAVLQHHLLVDAPEVLRPAGHLGADAQLEQPPLHGDQELRQVEIAFGILLGHQVIDLGVPLGVQGGERQVLQAALQFLHAEAMRQGRVDVEGLARHLLLLLRREGRQGAHVVEPVGKLDDENPQVLGHGHQHLAQRGGLVALAGRELDAVQLGDAVDDLGHLRTEVGIDVGQRAVGVLDDVVQQGRRHAHVVEPQASDDASHVERVLHERLARLAPLGPVGARRPRVGPLDDVRVGVTEVCRVLPQQRGDRPGGGMAPPRLQAAPRGRAGRLGDGDLGGRPDAHDSNLTVRRASHQ